VKNPFVIVIWFPRLSKYLFLLDKDLSLRKFERIKHEYLPLCSQQLLINRMIFVENMKFKKILA